MLARRRLQDVSEVCRHGGQDHFVGVQRAAVGAGQGDIHKVLQVRSEVRLGECVSPPAGCLRSTSSASLSPGPGH